MLLEWFMKTRWYFMGFFFVFLWVYYFVLTHKHTYSKRNKHTFQKIVFKVIFPSSQISIHISVFLWNNIQKNYSGAIYSPSDSQMANVECSSEKEAQPKSVTSVMELPLWNPGHRHLGNQMLLHNGWWFQ